MSAKVATIWNLAGSWRKADAIPSRSSRRTAGAGGTPCDTSSGSSTSRRTLFKWSSATFVAIRRVQAPKLPAGLNRARNPPKRFHRQILRRPRVPDDPKNPTVNLPLELSKQCFESVELPLREPLQEFHLLFSTISY